MIKEIKNIGLMDCEGLMDDNCVLEFINYHRLTYSETAVTYIRGHFNQVVFAVNLQIWLILEYEVHCAYSIL